MEKVGLLFAINKGELICNCVYQLRANNVNELMIVGVEQEDGSIVDEVFETETGFTSFEELESYFDGKTAVVLIFDEYETLDDALQKTKRQRLQKQ